MKYNKYCSNKYSSKYNTDKDNFTSNGYNEAFDLNTKEYNGNYNAEYQKKMIVESRCGEPPIEPICPPIPTPTPCPCKPNTTCNNCIQPCKCCSGVQCDFNAGNIESIRTLVKRLFASETAETCPAIEAITAVQGGTTMDMTVDVIPCSCNCTCPAIDATSKFTVNCVQVDTKTIVLGDPEVKLNGKTITVTKNTLTGCYDGIITKDMLKCTTTCEAEKGELCIRAQGWTFEGTITIKGCVVTAGQGCEFVITMTPTAPIEFADNTVFYMGDICATDGDLKLCFVSKFCLLVDTITSDGTNVTVNGSFKMNVDAQVNIYKDQEVCIQAVIVG